MQLISSIEYNQEREQAFAVVREYKLKRLIGRAYRSLWYFGGWTRMQRHYNLLARYEREFGAY